MTTQLNSRFQVIEIQLGLWCEREITSSRKKFNIKCVQFSETFGRFIFADEKLKKKKCLLLLEELDLFMELNK